ncbi:hypothetical protein LINPERPRIM_LOCUS3767 [Linum perenne]
MKRRMFTGSTMLIMSTNTTFPILIQDLSLVEQLAIDTCGSWIVGLVLLQQRTKSTTIVVVLMMLKLNSKIALFGSR